MLEEFVTHFLQVNSIRRAMKLDTLNLVPRQLLFYLNREHLKLIDLFFIILKGDMKQSLLLVNELVLC